MNDIIIIIRNISNRHASPSTFRRLVLPLRVVELCFELKLFKRRLLNVEIVFIGQNFIILLPRVVTFGSHSTCTFTGLSSWSILADSLGIGGQVDAVRLDPVLTTLIIGVQSWWAIRSCHR